MLSIILPTYNEAKNLPQLIEGIAGVMGKEKYEVIVVDDDSPDRTWEIANALQKKYAFLRVIHRVGRRGLSSAVVEGFDAASGDILLVMDSDLQHDVSLIIRVRDAVLSGADLAVASRYIDGGSVGEWVRGRRVLSRVATWLTRKIPAVEVSDPMSGFFALKQSRYKAIRSNLRPSGFKILFEILGHLPCTTNIAEIPLVFAMRMHGESKLSYLVEMQFLWQLLRIAVVRFQAYLFWGVCMGIASVLLSYVIPLLPLYTNPTVRSQVQTSMRIVADAHGWLVSDMQLLQVDTRGMKFAYQPHRKGVDPHTLCYTLSYTDLILQPIPCADY